MRHVGRHVHTPQATRMRLMDTLLQSGLPVQSYGGCRNNQNEVWRQQGVRLQHIRNNQNAAAKLALDACTRHRIMLAAESRNCPGWAAWNLEHALRDRRAIPLVNSIDGVPDYAGLFGDDWPHIDAGRPGWLREVWAVMTNDTHYRHLLEHGARKGKEADAGGSDPTRGRRSTDIDRKYHCQWHEIQAR